MNYTLMHKNISVADIEIDEDIMNIGSNAFSEMTSMKTISLPQTMQRIGKYALGLAI